MAELKETPTVANKHPNKHNAVYRRYIKNKSPAHRAEGYDIDFYLSIGDFKDSVTFRSMEANNSNRAPDSRPPTAGPISQEPGSPSQQLVRPPLNRLDSRSNLQSQPPRPVLPPQSQPRPQFQPGGPVSNSPQVAPRPGIPAVRGPASIGPPGSQQLRPQSPSVRPLGPQSFAPQQGSRPQQSPTSGQLPQRAPPPNNLQLGPRQVPQFRGTAPTTPDGSRPQLTQPPKNGVGLGPATGQFPRQTSQGSIRDLDQSTFNQNKTANLDNQSPSNDTQYINKTENGVDMPGLAKGRSYSIAAAPGAPSPLKMEDDRRKSVSAIGGRIDEFASRSPTLGLIQEGKIDSKDSVRGSTESIKSNESRDIPDRPESRLAGSKMTESIIGSLSNSTPKKKLDDDDDVVLQNNLIAGKNVKETSQNENKPDLSDRSPSLTRSDESPEPKQKPVQNPLSKSQTSEPQRPKTPKIEAKPEIKTDTSKIEKPAVTPVKTTPISPVPDMVHKKPNELNMSTPTESRKSTPRKSASAPKSRPKDGDNDSGVDESTQGNELNGSPGSPNKKTPSKLPTKEKSSSSLKHSLSRSSSKSATAKTPENPTSTEKKKVPMNKVQVGNAPSPNIKTVKSKIGSLENATYKPGGGKVKIENRKLDFNKVTPKIAAKNDAYVPSGGTKKIITTKLEWNAKSKVGSLQNAAYKPGGGDKKIETVKLDFKDKAKPKVASTANITHKPGGGEIKIENQKLDFKAKSKVGSLDNVKHKPGGGDIKIFDDKDYIKQMGGESPVPSSHSHSRQESPIPPQSKTPKSDENLNQQQC